MQIHHDYSYHPTLTQVSSLETNQSVLSQWCLFCVYKHLFFLSYLHYDMIKVPSSLSIPREKLEVSKLYMWGAGGVAALVEATALMALVLHWCYETTLGKPQHASQSSTPTRVESRSEQHPPWLVELRSLCSCTLADSRYMFELAGFHASVLVLIVFLHSLCLQSCWDPIDVPIFKNPVHIYIK